MPAAQMPLRVLLQPLQSHNEYHTVFFGKVIIGKSNRSVIFDAIANDNA